MTTFDAWEVGIGPSDDCLVHFGIRGMKHGRNRYQNEDGTWTEEGLRRRRQREGFGASKEQKKAAKAAAKTEKKAARKAARVQARADAQEARRKRNVKNLSDEELKNRIERIKMENEYRELSRSPFVKTGEKLIANYLKNKAEKEERAYNEKQLKATREYEMKRLLEQTKQTELRTKADTARANADKAKADTDKLDIESGTRMVKLKNEGKNLKLQGKRYVSDYTIRGGARKMINKILSGHGDAEASLKRGMSDANIAVKQAKKLNRYNNPLIFKRHAKNGTPASIPEGGFNYGNTNPNDNNNNKKKKQKGQKS